MAPRTRKSTSTAVAPRPSAVPALVTTPALEITAEDVALPRLYIGQPTSAAVKNQIVKPGSLFVGIGADDADPEIMHELGDAEGVLFHVLGMRKGKSLAHEGGELETWAFNDPTAPPEAWTTYQYFLALPEHPDGTDVPVKYLMTKSARPCAQVINLTLSKNISKGPAWNTAFRLTTARRDKGQNTWYVPLVRVEPADAANVAVAEQLAVIVSGQGAEAPPAAPQDEPSI